VIEDQDIHDMGTTIVPRLTMAQLQAAYEHYAMKHAHSKFMTTSFSTVNRVLCNHWRSCLKMPAGGANAGGSQQTGFELELITSAGARAIFSSWPNHQFIRLGHTWEARTMEEAELLLCFEELPAGWGVGNAKPAPCTSGSKVHKAILMAAPPITVTYQLRQDTTGQLTVRAPLIIYTEEDAILLPPDDKEGVPFYMDPADRPGMHADLFRVHARKMVRRMLDLGWPLSNRLKQLGA